MPQLLIGDYPFESVLLVVALLLVISVIGSRFSSLAGMPSLLVFLGIGMLAGSEGPGGIEFTNYPLSFALGAVALAFIIFDGGMRTRWQSVRPILGVGVSLASLGVLLTGLAAAAFARYAFDLTWLEALLLGAIVSSTDAAAVFSILRARSLGLKGNVKQLLEFEAGSNDPAAVLLTAGVLAFITNPDASATSLGSFFAAQVFFGLMLGAAGGWAVVALINRVGIEYEGLYSVLLFAFVALLFGATTAAGGSGFLAVYIAGLVVGNAKLLHKTSLLKFQDGIAWIAQIALFLILGLLVFPSHLPEVWTEGLLLGAFLILVARPFCVLIAGYSRQFSWRERLFISWVGLRGAAPILLATLPWSVGLPNAEALFNLVFFVVLISVIAQGTTVPWAAKALGVVEPLREEPDDGRGVLPAGFVFVEIEVQPGAPAANRRLFELRLPSGVVLTSVERDGRYAVPAGDTRFSARDRVLAFARPSTLETLREAFGQARERERA